MFHYKRSILAICLSLGSIFATLTYALFVINLTVRAKENLHWTNERIKVSLTFLYAFKRAKCAAFHYEVLSDSVQNEIRAFREHEQRLRAKQKRSYEFDSICRSSFCLFSLSRADALLFRLRLRQHMSCRRARRARRPWSRRVSLAERGPNHAHASLTTEHRVTWARRAWRGCRAGTTTPRSGTRTSLAASARLAPRVLPDRPGWRGRRWGSHPTHQNQDQVALGARASKACWATRESPAGTANAAAKGCGAKRASLAPTARRASKARRAPTASLTQRGCRGSRACPASQAQQVKPGSWARPASLESLAHPARQESRAARAPQEARALGESPGQRGPRAGTPTTVRVPRKGWWRRFSTNL